MDESKPPTNSVLTIFTNNQYIEVDESAKRSMVVDPSKSRITLLDEKRKMLVHFDLRSIQTRMEQALNQLPKNLLEILSSDGKTQEEPGGFFSVGNSTQRYMFKPVAAKQDIATSYADYANWSVRMTSLYPPRRPPQLMRLELNELLAGQSQLPEEIRLTRKSKDGREELVVAKLILTESLTDNDRSHVANILQAMQTYKPTSDDVFFR